MERLPYWSRARQRIRRETLASIKGRINPFVIALIGVAVGGLYSWLELHKQATETVKIGLIAGLGANVIWVLGVLVYHTVRVPRLLDSECGEFIDAQESRALIAEARIAEINAAKQKQELFAQLMQQGIAFSNQIAECHTPAHFASWDLHFGNWLQDVQRSIREMNFASDAIEFSRAKEKTASVTSGPTDFRRDQEIKRRLVKAYQDTLSDFVSKRLG